MEWESECRLNNLINETEQYLQAQISNTWYRTITVCMVQSYLSLSLVPAFHGGELSVSRPGHFILVEESLYRPTSKVRGPRNASGRIDEDINRLSLPEIKRRFVQPPPLSWGSISCALSRVIMQTYTKLTATWRSYIRKHRKLPTQRTKHACAYVYNISLY
jgi:hypothetical protein